MAKRQGFQICDLPLAMQDRRFGILPVRPAARTVIGS